MWHLLNIYVEFKARKFDKILIIFKQYAEGNIIQRYDELGNDILKIKCNMLKSTASHFIRT